MKKEVTVKVKSVGVPQAESLKYRLVSDQMINLTRDKAFEILEYDTFSGERPVREHHVQNLYDEWLAGRFLWHQAMVAHGIVMENAEGGTRKPHVFRLNGQHTCWMRVNIPKDKEPRSPCKVRQLIYECSDMDGLREIYSVIDRNAPRTNAHIAKVLLADTATWAGIPISYLNSLVGGMKLWLWESAWERHHKGNPQEMAALVNGRYSDLFRIVGRYFQIKYSEWIPIRRASTVAAMFATFDKAGGDAPNFWDGVCSGLGLETKTDPRYQMRLFNDEHTLNLRTNKKSADNEEMYRVAINLWNKWRRHEPVTVARSTDHRVKPV